MNSFKLIGNVIEQSIQAMPIQATDQISYDGCRFAIETNKFTASCCSLDKYIHNAIEILNEAKSQNKPVVVEGFLFFDMYAKHSSLAVATKIEIQS